MTEYPTLQDTVLDAADVRGLAEFYRELLGLRYRPGEEPPAPGEPDDADWLVLTDADGRRVLAFQSVPRLPRATWPEGSVPQQMHLDLTVPGHDELLRHHRRVLDLGGTVLLDRSADPEEELFVYADPAGHPFCLFVA